MDVWFSSIWTVEDVQNSICSYGMCNAFTPAEDRGKMLNSGRGEGCLFTTEPDLLRKANTNNTLSSTPVGLLRSTDPRIKLGLTQGQEKNRLEPPIYHTSLLWQPRLSSVTSAYFTYHSYFFCSQLIEKILAMPFVFLTFFWFIVFLTIVHVLYMNLSLFIQHLLCAVGFWLGLHENVVPGLDGSFTCEVSSSYERACLFEFEPWAFRLIGKRSYGG